MNKRIKIIVVIAVVVLLGWFLVLSPILKFHDNEKMVENAARRYYELNNRELPTGERIKTLSLKDIYYGKFLEKDVYAPFSKKTCSLEKSWVKVKRVDGEYKYYTYLDCGILKSNIDAVGPKITLNGDNKTTVGLGEEYKELGVKSVVDNKDGELKVSDVVIKGNVDTSKIGTYDITYTVLDSLNNRSTVTRTVEVVQKLYSTVKKQLGEATNYTGDPENNFIRLSNMLYRVYGVDDNKNVIIVSDEDVANINYSQIDKWLDYYYDHLNDKTKKMIVPSKFCNMQIGEDNPATVECSSYTKERNVYIPSVVDVNKAQNDQNNFMKTRTMSWVANKKGDKEAFVTRKVFYYEEYGKSFLPYNVNDNYGIRPMLVVKGGSLISDGDGSRDNPYTFGDTPKAKGGSLINKRFTGEYVDISGLLFRIVDVMKDGTTKVVSNTSIGSDLTDMTFYADGSSDVITYNPDKKSSVGYFINNKVSEYIDTKYFVEHEIEVPIYKNKIIYGKEVETKKYKAVLSAPNMYDMFSAQSSSYEDSLSLSYWLINTSKAPHVAAAIYDVGVPVNEDIIAYDKFGVRVVGYLKNNVVVNKGKGTIESPYGIK